MRELIIIREPILSDEEAFITAMKSSKGLHFPWIKSPQTKEEFETYIQRSQLANQKSFLACTNSGDIVGVFNISEIILGVFQSAYLGFYGVAHFSAKGYMSCALKLILRTIFLDMNLHRIEANIQPTNTRSINMIKSNGFYKEGFSPRYLKINGVWSDHERWALTYEDWQTLK